jgi:hypothetical protein
VGINNEKMWRVTPYNEKIFGRRWDSGKFSVKKIIFLKKNPPG